MKKTFALNVESKVAKTVTIFTTVCTSTFGPSTWPFWTSLRTEEIGIDFDLVLQPETHQPEASNHSVEASEVRVHFRDLQETELEYM